jgi:putative ABC transport system substrate-binding protein
MNRRELILGIGTVPVWPIAVQSQPLAMPVIGFLYSGENNFAVDKYVPAFREGLKGEGYVEGKNVVIDYSAAEGRYERLPALVAELIERRVAVILAAGGSEPAQAAKAATSTIPIVFASAGDPIAAGLVTSLSRPDGNVTGISLLGSVLEAKRLEFLHQLVPPDVVIAALVNPKYPDARREEQELVQAAAALQRRLGIRYASSETEVDAALAGAVQDQAAALIVAQDPFFNASRHQLVALASRYRLPAMYFQRESVEIGGLMSYGAVFADGFRQAGHYVGRILNGTKPADLPVMQPTKFELVINMRTANALNLTVPQLLLATADEVIE